jgi:hypothetical protein
LFQEILIHLYDIAQEAGYAAASVYIDGPDLGAQQNIRKKNQEMS